MTKKIVTPQNFNHIFLNNIALLDVRAEDEYAKGSFPQSINFPILNNEERRLVGKCYKQQGHEKAVKLGQRLVSGTIKADRLRRWCEFVAARPDAYLYCWRGGMRSNIAQQWLADVGVNIPLIEGGYKFLRRFLFETIEQTDRNVSMMRVGGKTGTGKSALVNQIACGIDLEKYANHRGSSFGGLITRQPTQINFEHALAIDLLRIVHSYDGHRALLFVEDEGRNIGAIYIPLEFFAVMCRSPIVLVEMSLECRVQHVLQEYIVDMLSAFKCEDAGSAFDRFSLYLTDGLLRIQKRLGLERYKIAAELMKKALQSHLRSGIIQQHEAWIRLLLTEYYDPMYEYQIEKKRELVVFRGNYSEVLGWAQQYHAFNTAV